jgi:hypothetical protein
MLKYKDAIMGVVRHVLTAAGGALAGHGVIAADDVTTVVGAVMTLVGVVFSVLAKKK